MPIPIRRLDANYPPVWTPPPDGEQAVTDGFDEPTTALRETEGQDPINYFTRQRVEGDLFNRDLASEVNVSKLRNFLSTRTGLTYNTPAVRLRGGDALLLGTIKVPSGDQPGTPAWGIVGSSFHDPDNTANTIRIDVVRRSDSSVVYTQTVSGDVFHNPSPVEFPLTSLLAGVTYDVLLRNLSGGRKTVSGSLIVQPRTYLP